MCLSQQHSEHQHPWCIVCSFFSYVGIAFGMLFAGALPLATLNSWFWSRQRRREPELRNGVHTVLNDYVVPSEIVKAASTNKWFSSTCDIAGKSPDDAQA